MYLEIIFYYDSVTCTQSSNIAIDPCYTFTHVCISDHLHVYKLTKKYGHFALLFSLYSFIHLLRYFLKCLEKRTIFMATKLKCPTRGIFTILSLTVSYFTLHLQHRHSLYIPKGIHLCL